MVSRACQEQHREYLFVPELDNTEGQIAVLMRFDEVSLFPDGRSLTRSTAVGLMVVLRSWVEPDTGGLIVSLVRPMPEPVPSSHDIHNFTIEDAHVVASMLRYLRQAAPLGDIDVKVRVVRGVRTGTRITMRAAPSDTSEAVCEVGAHAVVRIIGLDDSEVDPARVGEAHDEGVESDWVLVSLDDQLQGYLPRNALRPAYSVRDALAAAHGGTLVSAVLSPFLSRADVDAGELVGIRPHLVAIGGTPANVDDAVTSLLQQLPIRNPDSLWVAKLPGLTSNEIVNLASVLGELCRIYHDANPPLDDGPAAMDEGGANNEADSTADAHIDADLSEGRQASTSYVEMLHVGMEALRTSLFGLPTKKESVESVVAKPVDEAYLRLLQRELVGCPVLVTPAADESGVPTSIQAVRLFAHSCLTSHASWRAVLENVWPRDKVCTCVRGECELHTHLPSGATALAVVDVSVGASRWRATSKDIYLATPVARHLLRRISRALNSERGQVVTAILTPHLPQDVIDHVLYHVEPRAFDSALSQ
eukprot:CAMPEP_0170737678 /NCGR_PEP_ID=MMETSP0437-20130122/4249_1 /TAXON_ID=0 /ORGANISM="Sexangularia sp." /LENGTH=532 /DNA_ID=CAMNT_0011076069 /DNA_START=81 /DNA_END=1679 /DNA_ORIENTATION=-